MDTGVVSKIVCHLYNTTQLILVNGPDYVNVVQIFLKPFFESKISLNSKEIESFNKTALESLGYRQVRRATVRYKQRSVFSCKQCDYTVKTLATLNKHKVHEATGSLEFLDATDCKIHLDTDDEAQTNPVLEPVVTVLTDNDLFLPEAVAICSFCAKGYQTGDDCNAHMTCHTEFKEQKRNDQEITLTECCDICDEEFNSTIDLEYHMSLHTGVRHQSNVICVRKDL